MPHRRERFTVRLEPWLSTTLLTKFVSTRSVLVQFERRCSNDPQRTSVKVCLSDRYSNALPRLIHCGETVPRKRSLNSQRSWLPIELDSARVATTSLTAACLPASVSNDFRANLRCTDGGRLWRRSCVARGALRCLLDRH